MKAPGKSKNREPTKEDEPGTRPKNELITDHYITVTEKWIDK